MTRRSSMWVGLVAFGLVAGLFHATAQAAEPTATGTWTWTQKRQDQDVKMSLKLKQEGEKLTGELESPRGKTDISEGKAGKDGISFQVTREFNGNSFTIKYSGKVEGNTLKMKSEMERDGEKRVTDIEAKREGDKA